MFDPVADARVLAAAFEWLSDQVARYEGGVLPHSVLVRGFDLDGVRVPLVGPQGIFRPRVLREVPLSITTAPERPYDDSFGADDLLRYRYRGDEKDRDHPENRGLRLAMARKIPLVYFHGIFTAKYLAAWPVFVVADDPAALTFSVAVDDAKHCSISPAAAGDEVHEAADDARRRYVTAVVRVRLHQKTFRERVLEAYRRQCAFCSLRHEELLDAAHIVPDCEPEGEPHVRNGLALCALHHAAFDRHFLGLRPDYVLEVRPDILDEHDGPTLVHAIQALHGKCIAVPRRTDQRPERRLVELRYLRFREGETKRPA